MCRSLCGAARGLRRPARQMMLVKFRKMCYIRSDIGQNRLWEARHMKTLLLSCSTGEGHNHCALAVREALEARGHEAEFLDMLHLFGEPRHLNIETVLNTISSRTPEVFGMMYRAGQMYSSTGITSPVYLANIRYADELCDVVEKRGYDAVVCSHLFPMETLTFIRRHRGLRTPCYGVLSDYACIPFFKETELDRYFLPHEDVREQCIGAGMPAERLTVTGMPISSAFFRRAGKAGARAALGLPAEKKIYLVMTGGIGCGNALALCDAIRAVPDGNSLIVVLAGRNEELRRSILEKYGGDGGVRAVSFTDKVPAYMDAADVLLSKAGGISSSESAAFGVPLVHTMAIPGVETLNAEFFARRGMSFYAKNEDQAARFADRLVYDAAASARMLDAQRTGMPRDGAGRIVRRIEEDLAQ